MTHLSHPLDDGLFAVLCSAQGIDASHFPDAFDPGEEWGNDGIGTVLAGMPEFVFIPGDGDWHGVMAIYLEGGQYRREIRNVATFTIYDLAMPHTAAAMLAGGTFGRIAAFGPLEDLTVTSIVPHPDDPHMTEITLALPDGW